MQQLTATENTLLGILAGTTEICLLQPMLYWKNASQQKLPFTLNPKYLYRGILASAANMATLTAIQFLFTGKIKQLIAGNSSRELSFNEKILSALGGGAISGIACGPLELIMIQQQSGLFRGLTTSIGRESIFTAGYLGLAPVIIDYCKNNEKLKDKPEVLMGIASGLIGGFIAAGLTHPLDTIKTCMQGDIERKLYTNFTNTAKEIYTQGGIKRFYNGFVWRYGRMALSFYVINQARTTYAHLLYSDRF